MIKLAVPVPALALAWILVLAPQSLAQIPLPGSQPGTAGDLLSADDCSACHGNFAPASEPQYAWAGSMMAQAARDPLFYAALAIANQDVPDSGEYCLRCHTPQGWLGGRSLPADGSALNQADLHGVQCHSCHKMVDPMSSFGRSLVEPDVPGYGNAMMVLDPNDNRRGPYADSLAPHNTGYSPFFEQSQMCGTCHDVSNPLFADDVNTQPPHAYGVLERTFSEWELSSYPGMGQDYTCQGCHMPTVQGQVCVFGPERDQAHLHDFMGANTWIPDVIPLHFPDVDVNALQAAKGRALQNLGQAADLSVQAQEEGPDIVATVRVLNLTGHKLPTGYPEGRRMWLHVVAWDTRGDKVYESGGYDQATGILTLDEDIEVFEMKMGLSSTQATQHGLPEGESFHFILNDIVVKDNRIPPAGFANAAFAERLMEPVGAAYADGQHWADVEYRVPASAARLRVVLKYQTSSKEYIDFLRDNNTTNSWGDDLHASWEATGRSRPVTMAQLDVDLPNLVRAGNVDALVGGPTDVLFINGSSGDALRSLSLGIGEPIDIFLSAPSGGPASACYALYVWNGAPTESTITGLRRGVGSTVFPVPWIGGSPQPRFIWNNWGFPNQLGVADFASSKAPSSVFQHPGLGIPDRTFTFQGLIQNEGSLHGEVAVTNAVILNTTP